MGLWAEIRKPEPRKPDFGHRRAIVRAAQGFERDDSSSRAGTIRLGSTRLWESMPSFKMGIVGLKDFNAAYDAAQELTKDYATKDLELTGIRSNRDDRLRKLSELITRFRSGMRSSYGPDSVQYEQSGGTRSSAKKARVRNHGAAVTTSTSN